MKRNVHWWRDVALALIALTVCVVMVRIAVSGEYAHFIKESMRWPLGIAGTAMGLVSAWHLVAVRRWHGDDGHAHGGMVQVGSLMLIPILVLCFLPTPDAGPALVARKAPKQQITELPNLPPTGTVDIRLDDYVIRATYWDQKRTKGRTFKFIGYIARDKGVPYVARLKITCCVADALVYRVQVLGLPADLPNDLWVEVEGVAIDPDNGEARIDSRRVTPVAVPERPFLT